MPYDVKLTKTGISPERSMRAFIESYQETSKVSHYQKNKAIIEQYFKNNLSKNITQSNIKDTNLINTFSINFQGNTLQFVSKSNKAMKYEFGSGTEAPKRFIEPAVIEATNKISDIIISDAIELYQRKTRFG